MAALKLDVIWEAQKYYAYLIENLCDAGGKDWREKLKGDEAARCYLDYFAKAKGALDQAMALEHKDWDYSVYGKAQLQEFRSHWSTVRLILSDSFGRLRDKLN